MYNDIGDVEPGRVHRFDALRCIPRLAGQDISARCEPQQGYFACDMLHFGTQVALGS